MIRSLKDRLSSAKSLSSFSWAAPGVSHKLAGQIIKETRTLLSAQTAKVVDRHFGDSFFGVFVWAIHIDSV